MGSWLGTVRGVLPRRVTIGVTGLARSGKTALLTSIAANLLAAGAGLPTLPALTVRLGGRPLGVRLAAAGAEGMPRFPAEDTLAALVRDPPAWPERTRNVSLLALDLTIGTPAPLPDRRVRVEFLDYPGEWLLDLPLLGQSFAGWSAQVLRRLEKLPQAHDFLGFVAALPAGAGRDEALARAGHRLYAALLVALRAEGRALLQPGRFLLAPEGAVPPWMEFFPFPGSGPLAGLLRQRFAAYCAAVRKDLRDPAFGRVDAVAVLADLLGALHRGEAAFADAAAALGEAGRAVRGRGPGGMPAWLAGLFGLGLRRVAFVATKADHVAARQRGNLAALAGSLAVERGAPAAAHRASFAVAAVRCTEDVVWTLEGHPVSAVRGRRRGDDRPGRSWPGEVPDRTPGAEFWAHPFLDLPDFEPLRPPLGGRGGVPHVALDALLAFLLEDVL